MNPNELLSVATHQIRGPLGTIRGYISMILDGDYGEIPESLISPLEIISKSTASLSKTVNDFLDISRMEQGVMRYYLKDFDLGELVQEIIKEMEPEISKDGLILKTDLPNQIFKIHNDKNKIKHVLINLLDNAHKYTKAGSIHVGLKKVGTKVIFSVKDSGLGIAKETIPLLFQKFSRAPEAGKLNTGGTGLGLYIAHKIIQARHGRIWAESAGEGQGSQFYVELDSI